MATRRSTTKALYYHLALPDRLPQSQDMNIRDVEIALMDHLIAACRMFRDVESARSIHCSFWDSIRLSLAASKMINLGGRIDRAVLLGELRTLRDREFLVLHVQSQNAGILIHRCHS